MIYSLKDIYYINQALDLWLQTEDEFSADYEEENTNDTERGNTDD